MDLQSPQCRFPSLSQLNARWSRTWVGWGTALLAFVLASAFFIGHTGSRHSLTAPPGVDGDSPDYDNIGWQLSEGRGYSRDFSDPQFRAPYEAAGTAAGLDAEPGPVVDRPPLYPLVLASSDRIFGREFWPVRVVQGLMMGCVAAIAVKLAFDCAGLFPAILTAMLFTFVDWRTRWSVREILTEALACWLVTLLAATLILWYRRRNVSWIVLSGLTMGLLILCRTMAVLWLPVICFSLVGSAWREPTKRGISGALWFVVATVLVCLPWLVRNCRVLGEFRPLGTQGAEQLSAAYSDSAFRNLGMWFNLNETGFFADVQKDDPIERALARAELSSRAAREWIAEHPIQSILLWPIRVVQELRPHGPGELFVLAFALLGLGLISPRPEGRVGWVLLLAQVLGVAATWSVAGRFVIPLLGVLHVGAGVGLWGSYVMLVERRGHTRDVVLLAADC